MNPFTVLRDAWFFFRHNLNDLLILCMPWQLLDICGRYLLQQNLPTEQDQVYELLLFLIFYPMYSALLILFVQARQQGKEPSKAALLASCLSLWPRFLLLAGISTLIILFGLSLFILPGLWLMVRLLFAECLLVLHGLTPLQALHESWRLSRGHSWTLLACVAMLILPLWMLSLYSDAPGLSLGGRLALELLAALGQIYLGLVVFRLFILRTQRLES